ncbi:MAG TPA: nitrate- and nitrite sensing domain-containing protein [Micromonosporaceae bacterium]|nr:nitrate- and nitrite sensing domain-containing protein [Micromonosporaceae bacterium]
MSKQPKKANSVISRLRRPMGWLRDLPIWSKLGLIMIVPTVATIVVGANGVVDHAATAGNADRARALASAVEASGQLVHGLQNERSAAVLLLGHANGSAKKRYRDAYLELHPTTDGFVEPYLLRRAELRELPGHIADLLSKIDQKLADLHATRSQVTNAQLRLSDAIMTYDALISELLDMRDSAAQLATDFGLSQRMRAAAATARSKEYLSQKRIVVHRAMMQNELTPALRSEFIAAEQGEAQALQSFNAVATGAEVELRSQTVAGPDYREVGQYSNWVRAERDTSMKDAPFAIDDWDAALVSNARLIRNVEAEFDSIVVQQANALRDTVRRQLFIETGLLLGMLLLGILFAWLVARFMARSLRELRAGALAVAEYGLPQAVARLRDPQMSTQLSPTQVADQLAEPLPVRSKDELGQVVAAFNKVHLEAVRTAAEQAALRASVNTMFVNLARRSQILVDRLITNLDRIERAEEDPDRLAELFQLDHLVTRMRRNDENLLVLAGADSTRVQRQPAALMDVLRAAQSEVEHYTRIDFGMVDQDIDIDAQAVNDLVHLIAELLDNATAFSPPDSQVIVEARRIGDRVMLYVEDHGIGISPEHLAELNERLAKPPAVDVAVSRMMGLVVVARLAARHGVKVELRSASDRGVVAEVTIPDSVLAPSSRGQQSGNVDRVLPGQPPAPPQRRQLGALLALEGAPAQSRPAAEPEPIGGGGREFSPGPINGGRSPQPVSSTGSMPAWSDLTGAMPTVNSGSQFKPQPAADRIDPLPQRRATDQGSGDNAVTGGFPSIPRQIPNNPEARLPGVERFTEPPMVLSPPETRPAPPMRAPVAPPSMPPPPVWPPVAAGDEQKAPVPAPAPPPQPVAPAQAGTVLPPTSQPTASMPQVREPEKRPRFADETMELPIFRELESAWFRTGRSASDGVAATGAETAAVGANPSSHDRLATAGESRGSGAAAPVEMSRPMPSREGATPAGTAGSTAMMNTPISAGGSQGAGSAARPDGRPTSGGTAAGWGDGPAGGWQTPADQGWRAASAAAEVPVVETTRTGLPKRVPMAQLVPGGVEKPAATTQRRTPEAVRGLLSAYHRGVQRGRGNSKNEDSGATPAGQQFPQSGFGPNAGGSQKEHQG